MAKKNTTPTVPEDHQLPAGLDVDALARDAEDTRPELGAGDVALPFLSILQSGNPQVKPSSPAYIPGATEGMLYDNVSNEVFDGIEEGLLVVPCTYERKYVEWVPREAGGGWVGDYPASSNILEQTKPNDKKQPTLPNGNLVIETAYYFVLWMHPETGVWRQGVIPMKSTQLKKSRAWINELNTRTIPGSDTTAPWFLWPWLMQTVPESKNDNNWMNFKLTKLDEFVSTELYEKAKEFANLVGSGLITRSAEGETPHDPETGEVLDHVPV